MSTIDHKLGPLKTWQWALVAGAAGLLYWYEKKKSEESSSVSTAEPSESFNTGSPVGQTTEGSGGGGGTAAEQPSPLPAESHQTETVTAPGLGAGQLFATELEEVQQGREALQKLGLTAPAEGANTSSLKAHAEKEHKRILAMEKTRKAAGKKTARSRGRAKPTHAKQGSHAHTGRSHTQKSPHHGATQAASQQSKTSGPPVYHPAVVHHPVRHGSAHKKRRK